MEESAGMSVYFGRNGNPNESLHAHHLEWAQKTDRYFYLVAFREESRATRSRENRADWLSHFFIWSSSLALSPCKIAL